MHLNCRLILNYSSFSVTFYHEELDDKMDDAKTWDCLKLFPREESHDLQTAYNI